MPTINKKILIAIFQAMFFQTTSANEGVTLEFAKIANAPNQIIASRMLEQIYFKAKIGIKFIDFPGLRSIEETIKGHTAGEVHRIYSFGERYPTFIRILPAISYVKPIVFSGNNKIIVNGWKSISKYRVGIIRGIIYAEVGTKGMPSVTAVNSIEQLVNMLNLGRIDLFVTDEFNGKYILKKMGLNNTIKPVYPSLEGIVKEYHYLNPRYKYLVPRIQKVIQDMEKTGELEVLHKKLEQDILNNLKNSSL